MIRGRSSALVNNSRRLAFLGEAGRRKGFTEGRQNLSVSSVVGKQAITESEDPKSQPKTLSKQNQLPKLPLPSLEDTLRIWLRTVKPHVTNEEYAKTEGLAKEFMSGIGKDLQQYLAHRQSTSQNWFADWWLDMAYLGYRAPLPVFSSPGLILPTQRFANKNDWLAFTAKFIEGALHYKSLLDNERIPIVMSGKMPMDMIQHYRLFGAVRLPTKPDIDTQEVFQNSKHAVIAHQGNMYKLDLTDFSVPSIASALAEIVDDSERRGCQKHSFAGVLTSAPRDDWHKAFGAFASKNAETLDIIKKSLFVVCLDDNLPDNDNMTSLSKSGLNSLHGFGTKANGFNRWFDKALQFIVCQSGELSICNEHSFAEAVPTMAMADHILKRIKNSNDTQPGTLPPPLKSQYLPIVLGQEDENAIESASSKLDGLVDDLNLTVLDFTDFGKEFIKSQKVSPDSFVQLAIQLAFYRMHGVPGATYESASTRVYQEGRTEVIRSCSMESTEFARMMLSKDASLAERYNAFTNALKEHNTYARQASQGFGVDRHLQGLKQAALEQGADIHPIYSDVAYQRSSRMRLSTSQISSKEGGVCSYGPLETDGYGCSYSIDDNGLKFAISSMASCPETSYRQFAEQLALSLRDIHDLCVMKAAKL